VTNFQAVNYKKYVIAWCCKTTVW